MIRKLVPFLLLFISFQTFSQKLIYKSNGNILNAENQKISPDQVRELLSKNEKLLADYNTGRTKKTVGNVLLISGPILLVTGTFAYALAGLEAGMDPDYYGETDRSIPKIMAFVGLASMVVAIPVKIGFSKIIKNVVSEYNSLKATADNINNQKLDFITNSNGIGLRLTLN